MYKKQNVEYSTPFPRDNEVVGKVTRASGASNFLVSCSDGNERTCTIPGRLKRRFWIKEGDVVLVRPWVVQTNERGDIIWRYSMMDKEKLKAKGFTVP